MSVVKPQDHAYWFMMIDPNDIGASGLPIMQEIILVLVLLSSTALWLLAYTGTVSFNFNGVFWLLKFLNFWDPKFDDENLSQSKKASKNKMKHLALPAFVLTTEERKQLSKLLLPPSCLEKIGSAEFNEMDDGTIPEDKPKQWQEKSKEWNDKEDIKDKEKMGTEEMVQKGERLVKMETAGEENNLSKINEKFTQIKNSMKQNLTRLKRRHRAKREYKTYRFKATPECISLLDKKLPLLIFVNTKSGGQTGELLLYQLRALLYKYQVYDLIKDKGPQRGLKLFSTLPKFRILVCGGDGTVSWVLSEMDKFDSLESHKNRISIPESSLQRQGMRSRCEGVGVFPLGTGNDLAKDLGWGNGGSYRSLVQHLCEIAKANVSMLDRWKVCVRDVESEYKQQMEQLKSGKGADVEKDASINLASDKVMNNYLGIGVDAQIALNFHVKREQQPHLFTNRLLNKFWYASSGGKEILMQRFIDFSSKVSLFCDGKQVKIPNGIEGIIILNIKSYGGGVNLWGHNFENESFGAKENGFSFDEPDLDSRFEINLNKKYRRRSLDNLQLLNLKREEHLRHRMKQNRIDYHLSESYDSDNEFNDADKYTAKRFTSSHYDDEMLEVVGVQSSFQLGAAQVGLAKPRKLCQGKHILVHLFELDLCPVQIDGEPFILKNVNRSTGKIVEVTFFKKVNMLTLQKPEPEDLLTDDEEIEVENIEEKTNELQQRRSKFESIANDVFEWGVTKDLISESQKIQLASEMKRRLNSSLVETGRFRGSTHSESTQ